MSSLVHTHRKKKFKVPGLSEGIEAGDKDLLKHIILEMQSRARIKLSVYFILLSSLIPSFCRSARTNTVLAMARESMNRVERSLDVRQIIQTQDDLQLLLNSLMNKQ
jgi:hypothetical protein